MLDDSDLEVFSSLFHVPFTSCVLAEFSCGTSGFRDVGETCISFHGCSRLSLGADVMLNDMILL